jgi:(hydroxyamino)benzene mutase
MDTSTGSSRQGRLLLRAGTVLFLFALLVGLAVPHFAVPRLGLSAHLLGLMQGLFLMVAGLVWPRLELTRRTSGLGMWLLLYGCFAAWAANVLAAVLGAGSSLLPLAAGSARGTGLQESLIALSLRSAAAALIVATLLMVWGLRGRAVDKPAV